MTAKIHAIQRVWHVGTFPHEPRPVGQRSMSYEGDGLSVSIHPAAWAEIAQLGERAVALERRDGQPGRFLDGYAARADARAWGLAIGLALPITLYQAGGGEYTSEAFARGEHPRAKITAVAGVAPAPSFTTWLVATYGSFWAGNIHPVFEGELINRYAAALDPDLDGVWWASTYRPDDLSAPAGLILPARLTRWRVVQEAQELD